ncbi:MAG: DUF4249 domain-containing protein [Bacteroidota bacterium]
MKRMIKHSWSWLMLVAGVGLGACTEVIEIELDSTYHRLIVYGAITTDSVHHQVQLSTSSDYFSNVPSTGVSDARVELEFNENLITLEEHDTIPGLYLTPQAFRGIPHTKYQLHINQVDVDGDGTDETYHAESTMPSLPQLDSIRLFYFHSPFVSGYQVLMYAYDPPSRDWYNFKFWRNQDLLTKRLSDYLIQSDDFFNGTYIYGLPVGLLADDDPEEAVLPGDTITFELNSIEQMYYNFIIDAQLEIEGNNPLFSGPAANVRSNIDHDARGVFTAYSVDRVSLIVTE